MSNNLGPVFVCTYHVVTAAFPVYTPVAVTKSNMYVGRAIVLGTVYQQLNAEPGDEIHNLPGGVFYVASRAQVGIPVRINLPDRHIFEHRGPDQQDWPLSKLALVEQPRSVAYKSETPLVSTDQLHDMKAVRIGSTIDWLAP